MRLMTKKEIDSVKDCMIISEVKLNHRFDKPMEKAILKLEKCSFSSEKPDIFWENVGWKITSTVNGKESSTYIVASDFNIFGVFSAYITSVYADGTLELYPSNYRIDNNEIHQRINIRDDCFKAFRNCFKTSHNDKLLKQSQIDKTIKAYKESCLELIEK